MRLRVVSGPPSGGKRLAAELEGGWYPLDRVDSNEGKSTSMLALLEEGPGSWARLRDSLEKAVSAGAEPLSQAELGSAVLPLEPLSFRDFMLYEAHAIGAARGFVARYFPGVLPLARGYEAILGRPFPPLRPKKLWYQHPIYYMGNHLSFQSSETPVRIPSCTRELDYELEIGAILAHPLRNASPEDAWEAIGGFVVLNDFSARDVQLAEMRAGFGPVKAKNFASAMSPEVMTADEVQGKWEELKAEVWINGELVTRTTAAGPRYSMGEAISYASRDEALYPGEVFGSGTLPGCSGIEQGSLLKAGDRICLRVAGIGKVENWVTNGEESG